jgi:Site-specific recombinase XerD
MAVEWIKTNFVGVRYRKHATRKHGVGFDRCFSIRYKLNGKDKEEVAGWASEGVTAENAFKKLSTLRENIRLGVEPQTLAALNLANQAEEEEKAKALRRKVKEALTFAEFWHSTYFPSAEATKTPQTMNTEKGRFYNWISGKIGDIPLQKLTKTQVEGVALHALKSGKSPTTARHILADISQVWNTAASHGLVEGESPVRRIKKPRQDNRRMRFLTQEEARLLLDTLRERSLDVHDEALMALFCGLRAGEIYALIWGDVDLGGGTIHIRDTKNKRDRHAFISKDVRTMLERRFSDQTKNMFVFPSSEGKQRRWVSDTFSRTVDEQGLNDTGEMATDENGKQVPFKIQDRRQRVVFHSLRHTFASWLVQRGTPLYTVAELMGHTTLEMTKRYSHLAPDSLRKAAMSLEGSLDQTPATVITFRKAEAQS